MHGDIMIPELVRPNCTLCQADKRPRKTALDTRVALELAKPVRPGSAIKLRRARCKWIHELHSLRREFIQKVSLIVETVSWLTP